MIFVEKVLVVQSNAKIVIRKQVVKSSFSATPYLSLLLASAPLPNSWNSNWHFITNIAIFYSLIFFAILRPKWHSFILTFFRFMNGSKSFSAYLRLQSGVVNWCFLDVLMFIWGRLHLSSCKTQKLTKVFLWEK